MIMGERNPKSNERKDSKNPKNNMNKTIILALILRIAWF